MRFISDKSCTDYEKLDESDKISAYNYSGIRINSLKCREDKLNRLTLYTDEDIAKELPIAYSNKSSVADDFYIVFNP